jgi:hypothetical protein
MYLLSAVRFLGRIWRFIQKAARWLLQDFYALLLSDYQHANGVHQHCGGADYAAPAIHGLQLRSMFCCRNTAYLATIAIYGDFIKAYVLVAWLCWIPNIFVLYMLTRNMNKSENQFV